MKIRLRITAAAAAAATAAAATATGLATAGSAAGHAPLPGAGAFAARIVQDDLEGRWDVQYDDLHPAHQALLTRDQYVVCSARLGTAVPARVRVVRTELHGDRALVTLRMRSLLGRNAATLHVHTVAVEGRWRWILGKRFLAELAHHRCLDGSPLYGGPPA
jgi:hypothetical protein